MNRLVILTAGVALLFSTGCTHDGEFSVRKALGLEDAALRGAIKTPGAETLPRAKVEVAERVELLGRKVVSQNTFTGIEPMFFTIGVKDNVLFHRGSEELFISEGLVEKCKTDAELVAVLCAELGQMVAEKRTAKATGRGDVDPIPDAGFGGNTLVPGGTAIDPGRDAEIAFHERKYPRGANSTTLDATNTAKELLQGSGYSVGELDRVEPLLKQSKRGEELRKQMGGSAPKPEWQK